MAKKKTVVTTEEEVTPEDIKYQDIHDNSMEDIALKAEINKIEGTEPQEEPQEEAPVVEEPVVETPAVEETPAFDPEKLKQEAKDEAKNEILAALKGNTAEKTEENVDEYATFQKGIWEKEGRQPTWTEAANFIKDKAKAEFRAEEEAKEAERVKQAEEQTQAQTANNEATNKYVEDTLKELYENEKLPRIQNKDNPDDYGIRTRNALFSTIIDVNQKRLAANQTPKTVKEIFYEDFKMPNRDVAGGDAPVNMGRGGSQQDDSEEIDYQRDLQGKSFRQILGDVFKR